MDIVLRTSINLYQVPGRHIQRNDSLHWHLLKTLQDLANVTQTFIHIASLRRTGIYSRRERRCLQGHCLCDAHGLHEVQAERSRGTGWGRRYGGKCPNTPSPTTHPPTCHSRARTLGFVCSHVIWGLWRHVLGRMVPYVCRDGGAGAHPEVFSGDAVMNLRLFVICLIFKYYDVKVV